MLGSLSLNSAQHPQRKNIVRSIFGVIFSMLIALQLDLVSPQLSALFAIMLLSKGSKNLGVAKSVGAVAVIGALGLFGLFIGNFIQDYPLQSILTLGLIIFWSFRLVIVPEPLRMMFLIFSITFPFLSLTAKPISYLIYSDILINLIIAMFMTQLAFLFFPQNEAPKATAAPKMNDTEVSYNFDKVAFNGVLMLLPVTIFFFYFQLYSYIITFVYIIVLGLDPLVYKSKYPFIAVFANLLGGAAAYLAYNLLIIAPDFFFYIVLLIAAALFFSYHIFSDKKGSSIFYPMAYRSFYLVLSIIFTSSGSVGDSLTSRLFGIFLAIIYTVIAYQFINLINNPIKYGNKET